MSDELKAIIEFISEPAYSGVIGTLGFLVSVFGFWLAIDQIKRVKAAADAARDAVSNSLLQLRRTSAIGEIKQCVAYVNSASQSIEVGQPGLGSRNLDFAKQHIIRFNALNQVGSISAEEDQREKETLKVMVREMADLSKRLRTVSPNRVTARVMSEFGGEVTTHHEFLLDFIGRFEIKEQTNG